MTLLLSDLFTPSTKDEILEEMLTIGESVGLPLRSWQKMGIGRTILELVASILATQDLIREEIVKSGFLDFAVHTDGTINPWLTVLAHSVYDVDRIEATFATAAEGLRLTNASASPITISSILHFAKPDGSASYTCSTALPFTVPASGTIDVDIVADVAGSVSNASPGEITVMVTAVSNVTCDNILPLVGSDQESDAALAARCRLKLGSLSPKGASSAYEYFALSAEDENGVNLGVTRVGVVADVVTGIVDVFLADGDGPVTGSVVTAVDAILQEKAVPDAVNETTLAAVELDTDWTLTVYAKAPVPTAQNILDAMLVYFATIPIGGIDVGGGGKVFRDRVSGAIHAAYPSVELVTISSPGTDVSMSTGQVAVLTSTTGDITIMPVT